MFCSHTVSAQDDDDIILMRIVPDLETQELPCADQMIVYECQQLISSSDLIWFLPNDEMLRFSFARNINDNMTSDDDNYIATITNTIDGDEIDTVLFTSTLMILEPVDDSTVRCTGGINPRVSAEDTITLSGRSLLSLFILSLLLSCTRSTRSS